MSDKRYTNLKEFYPFYLSEHQNPISRKLHFSGTLFFFSLLLYGVISGNYSAFIFMPIVGYGFAWLGHFFFEKNKPATFQYPLFSLLSDFKLFFHLLIGKQKFTP